MEELGTEINPVKGRYHLLETKVRHPSSGANEFWNKYRYHVRELVPEFVWRWLQDLALSVCRLICPASFPRTVFACIPIRSVSKCPNVFFLRLCSRSRSRE